MHVKSLMSKRFHFFVGMSLEHFVFKNKLWFYLYQHHFHCLISGRQRQKNGNSETNWEQSWYWNLNEIKSVVSMQLKSISFESPQLDIFLQFFDKVLIFEGRKKEQQTLSSQLSCEISSDRLCAEKSSQATLILENRNHQLDPAAAPVPALGEPGHSVLAVCFGSSQAGDFSKGGWCWSCCLHQALCQQFKY